MKRKIKQFMSLLMSLLMVMCMSFPVMAENEGSITITKAVEGETYSIYKMFDLAIGYNNEQIVSYSYTVTDDWEEFFTDGEGSKYITINQFGQISDFTFESNSPESSAFAKAALEYAEDKKITATQTITVPDTTGTADGDGTYTITFSNLELGYYLVDTTVGTLCMLGSTTKGVSIEEKNVTPTLSKEVAEDDASRKEGEEHHEGEMTDGDYGTWGDGDNNQTMTYHLTIHNIHDVSNLKTHDYLEHGLDLGSVTDVTIYNNDGSVYHKLSSGEYDFSTGTCTDPNCIWKDEETKNPLCTFEVLIHDDVLSGIPDEAYLVITYTATLITDVDDYEDFYDEVVNHSYATFGLSFRHSTETPVDVETDLFGFQVYKYGILDDPDDLTNVLKGAKFILSNNTQYAKFKPETSDGHTYYIFDSWTTKKNATELETDAGGYIRMEGLDDDTYYLIETEAPAGYNLLEEAIKITIDEYGVITYLNGNETVESTNKTVYIGNAAGNILPKMGGAGTVMLYVSGIILMAGACVALLVKSRTKK